LWQKWLFPFPSEKTMPAKRIINGVSVGADGEEARSTPVLYDYFVEQKPPAFAWLIPA